MLRIRFPGRVLAATLLVLAIVGRCGGAEPIRVMTFNVRYGTADDGPNRWELRREFMLRVIREFDPDLLGVQEALRDQLDAIGERLPGHVCVGVGRDADGGGEYSALFYRSRRFDLDAAGTFWLSDTPDEPGSHTWGNELPRICTWARLAERDGGRRFVLFNTHWDHISQPAREAGGALMAKHAAARIAAGDPVLVTGDFNAAPGNAAIAALTQRGAMLRDAWAEVHPSESSAGTYHGFKGVAGPGRIDAVLTTDHWTTLSAEIVRTADHGRYPSDHFPVTAVVELKPAAGPPAK